MRNSWWLFVLALCLLSGCAAIPSYDTADKHTETVAIDGLYVVVVTNRAQLPTSNPQAVGLWRRNVGVFDWQTGQFGEREEIWILAVQRNGKFYIDAYVLGHELQHALHFRSSVFPNPDDPAPVVLSTPSRSLRNQDF